jgi:sigma-E factor negative regulatory protein RseC
MNPRRFEIGDEVILGLQENALVKGSLMLYTLPLISMFAFAILGYGAFSLYEIDFTEGFKILFSLGGLAFGFVWVSRYSKKINKDPDFQAVILSRIGNTKINQKKLF